MNPYVITDVAELLDDQGEPRADLMRSVERAVMATAWEAESNYRGTTSNEVWSAVGDFVLDATRRFLSVRSYTARAAVYGISRIAAQAYFEGVPLEDERVFGDDFINHFIAVGLPELKGDTRATYRSWLRSVRRALVPGAETWGTPIRKSGALPPHTVGEVVDYRSLISAMPEGITRRCGLVLLAACRGAGLEKIDLDVVCGTDVERVDGICVVHVSDRLGRGRDVPVLSAWADELLLLAADAGHRNLYRPDLDALSRNAVTDVALRINRKRDPRIARFEPRRLRSAWLVEHLEAGTPAVDLMRAAAFATAWGLHRYLEYARPLSDDAYRYHLANPTARDERSQQNEGGVQ